MVPGFSNLRPVDSARADLENVSARQRGVTMKRINPISIDTSQAVTDMCWLGTEFDVDKSPYRYRDDPGCHRHPYTAVYDMLFANLRNRDIRLGEVGILDNMSMLMWRNYFPHASLYGFEYDQDKIAAARQQRVPCTHYFATDVRDPQLLSQSFNAAGQKFDVLIDDSTHQFAHQINFINAALDYVAPGGMLIVEDIFRDWPTERYEEALRPLFPFFASAFMIETNHERRYSGGTTEPYFNNDKLLVLWRSATPRGLHHPNRDTHLRRLRDVAG